MPALRGPDSPTPSTGGVAAAPGVNAPPGYNQLQQMWGAYQQGVLAPQQANDQSQIQSLLSQLQVGNAQGNVQANQLQQQYGFDLSNLGLQQGQNTIQQGALNRQNVLAPQLQELQNQLFGIQGSQLGLSAANLQTQAALQQRGATSSATASGAVNSKGYGQQLGDIQAQLQSGLSQNQLQQQQLGISEKQSSLNYNEQTAQRADQQKQLDLASRSLGISGAELKSRLDSALQQIGLSNQLTSDQVVGEIANIKNGQYSQLSQIMPTLAQAAGLNLFAAGG